MRLFFLIAIFFFSSLCNAQVQDSLTLGKGRYITSLFGSIKSQLVEGSSNGSISDFKTNGYTLGTKSGIFIKNAWAIGLHFSLSKAEKSDVNAGFISEELLIGLWNRWYFVQFDQAALFVDLTPYYTTVHNHNIIDVSGFQFDEELHGRGFGFEPGLGFTYFVNRNVGFGMIVSYPTARVYADRKDLILNTSVSETYSSSQLAFSFSFQVYLDKFFF